MKFGVLVFPGSNCDQDAFYAIQEDLKQPVEYIWHQQTSVGDVDAIIVPGGFSYGDYLRCGAVARFSPVMQAVEAFAQQGGLVIGVCNGFQILCEAHLLPGALIRNDCLRFVCKHVKLKVENASTQFTQDCQPNEILNIPIAHGEGKYVADEDTLQRLNANGQVMFRYVDASGNPTEQANPNGSAQNIAGICNEKFNVLGMMPHPERACNIRLGSKDGIKLFTSMVRSGISALGK